MIKKGHMIRIRPEFQDEGDGNFTWVAREDEEQGRVGITALGTGLVIAPWQTVSTDMLLPAEITSATGTVAVVAAHFCRVLAEWLAPAQIAEAVALNRAEHLGICHTADYCDANLAMSEAFARSGLPEFAVVDGDLTDAQRRIATGLWNAAWDLAKASQFDPALAAGCRVTGDW